MTMIQQEPTESDQQELVDDGSRLDRPQSLRFIGDTGLANLSRTCGWMAHELFSRSPGNAFSTIQTGDAGVGNLHALGRGEVDVAVITPSAVAALAIDGKGPFVGSAYPHLRALGELPHPDQLLFAVRSEVGVSSVAELRDRRVPIKLVTSLDTPTGSFVGYAVERVLAAAGISPEAIRSWGGEVISRDTPFECLAVFEEEGANAVLHEAIMTPWWQTVAEKFDLSFLSFEPEVRAIAAEELECPPAQIEAGYMHGLDEAVDTVDFSGYLVVAREDMAEDLAYLLTWILGEASEKFIAINYRHIAPERSPVFHPIEREHLVRSPIPLHPGAARYYEQAGEDR